MRRKRLIDVTQRRTGLLSFDHAVDFFNLADQIRATEFEFLAAAARADCVRIDGHTNIHNGEIARLSRTNEGQPTAVERRRASLTNRIRWPRFWRPATSPANAVDRSKV